MQPHAAALGNDSRPPSAAIATIASPACAAHMNAIVWVRSRPLRSSAFHDACSSAANRTSAATPALTPAPRRSCETTTRRKQRRRFGGGDSRWVPSPSYARIVAP